jgi:hypothetical protein
MYKRKADKVRPVDADIIITKGSKPGRLYFWKKAFLKQETKLPPRTGPYDRQFLTKKFSDMPRGSRLTPEILASIKTGVKLRLAKRHLLEEMLYNWEAALGLDFKHVSKVHPTICPL